MTEDKYNLTLFIRNSFGEAIKYLKKKQYTNWKTIIGNFWIIRRISANI